MPLGISQLTITPRSKRGSPAVQMEIAAAAGVGDARTAKQAGVNMAEAAAAVSDGSALDCHNCCPTPAARPHSPRPTVAGSAARVTKRCSCTADPECCRCSCFRLRPPQPLEDST